MRTPQRKPFSFFTFSPHTRSPSPRPGHTHTHTHTYTCLYLLWYSEVKIWRRMGRIIWDLISLFKNWLVLQRAGDTSVTPVIAALITCCSLAWSWICILLKGAHQDKGWNTLQTLFSLFSLHWLPENDQLVFPLLHAGRLSWTLMSFRTEKHTYTDRFTRTHSHSSSTFGICRSLSCCCHLMMVSILDSQMLTLPTSTHLPTWMVRSFSVKLRSRSSSLTRRGLYWSSMTRGGIYKTKPKKWTTLMISNKIWLRICIIVNSQIDFKWPVQTRSILCSTNQHKPNDEAHLSPPTFAVRHLVQNPSRRAR